MTAKMCALFLTALAIGGCLRVKVDPLEVKPITLNVNLKIDRELDDVFDETRPVPALTPPSPATTQAADPLRLP